MTTSAALILSLKHILSISDTLLQTKYERKVLDLERRLNVQLNKAIPYNNVIDNINDELCAIAVSISSIGKTNPKL